MDITLQLPDQLVREAQAAGLLTSEKLVELIQTEVNRYHHRRTLLVNMQHLERSELPVASDEIEVEIQVLRQERAANRSTEQE